MVYYKNGKYHISNLKVHYVDEHEGEVIKFVGQEGKRWWIDFAEQWEETFKLKGFEEVEVTDEQLARLKKTNELNLQEGVTLIDEYVLENDLSKVTLGHPLYVVKLEFEMKKENQTLKKSSQMSLATIMQLDKKVLELEKKINEISK